MFQLIVAALAPIVSTVQSCPQLYKTYTSKKVKDLSLYSMILMLTASLLWFLHGYFISDNSLMLGGGINVIINAMLLLLYFIYSKNGLFT